MTEEPQVTEEAQARLRLLKNLRWILIIAFLAISFSGRNGPLMYPDFSTAERLSSWLQSLILLLIIPALIVVWVKIRRASRQIG